MLIFMATIKAHSCVVVVDPIFVRYIWSPTLVYAEEPVSAALAPAPQLCVGKLYRSPGLVASRGDFWDGAHHEPGRAIAPAGLEGLGDMAGILPQCIS